METGAGTMFDVLIWAGAAVTLAGLALLIWCILRVARARRDVGGESAVHDALRKVVPLNLAALFLSAIGLMLVVLGVILS